MTELLVVVVGVLIALWADRWVQTLDERATEQAHLTWLIRDLQADSALLDGSVAWERERVEQARRLLQAAYDPSAAADPERRAFLARAFQRVGWSVPPASFTATWEEMVAAGDLSLVRDTQLRRQLSQYYAALQWIQENEGDREYRLGQLEDRTLRLHPPTPEPDGGFRVDDSEAQVRRILSMIDTDAELAALIGYAGSAAASRIDAFTDRIAVISQLLDALRLTVPHVEAP